MISCIVNVCAYLYVYDTVLSLMIPRYVYALDIRRITSRGCRGDVYGIVSGRALLCSTLGERYDRK